MPIKLHAYCQIREQIRDPGTKVVSDVDDLMMYRVKFL